MSELNGNVYKTKFNELYADAVIWKATKSYKSAGDDFDALAESIDTISEMLIKIENEAKRSAYITDIQKKLAIKDQLVKKRVRDLLAAVERAKQDKIARAKLENSLANAEDAGLPANFKGNVYDALKYGIYEHEGVYFSKGPKGDYAVSNFTMKILYHSDTGEETAFRLIAIKNVFGFECVINFNTDDFVSLGPFKKIIARRGNYIFKGTDSDLSRLQELLQKDEKKTKFVGSLGYQKNGQFWAWANGIVPLKQEPEMFEPVFVNIDEHGIVDYNSKHYFIPYGSQIYAEKDNLFEKEKRFTYRPGEKLPNFKKWNELFCNAYKKEKAVPATLHYLGALFRDIVMRRVQRFPLLNLFGPPQSGKGALAESLMYMFGEKQDQIMLEGQSTAKGFMRSFGQLTNAYVWLDEFKNNLSTDIIGSIKNLFDGKGYTRAKRTNDLQTDTTPVNSSCILSGQDLPTGEAALFTRIIPIFFNDGNTRDEDQKKHFFALRDLEIEGGFPHLTSQIVQHRPLVEKSFEGVYKEIKVQLMRELINPKIDDRFIDNISILLAFRKLFNGILDFDFSYEEALKILVDNVTHHQLLKQGNDDVSKWWNIIEILFVKDLIKENRDFELEDGYLYLKIQNVHPFYHSELIQRREVPLAKQTIEHYLEQNKQVYEGKVKKQFKDGSYTWATKFVYRKLNINLIRVYGEKTESQRKAEMNIKYKEMGVDLPDSSPDQLNAFVPIEGEGF